MASCFIFCQNVTVAVSTGNQPMLWPREAHHCMCCSGSVNLGSCPAASPGLLALDLARISCS